MGISTFLTGTDNPHIAIGVRFADKDDGVLQ